MHLGCWICKSGMILKQLIIHTKESYTEAVGDLEISVQLTKCLQWVICSCPGIQATDNKNTNNVNGRVVFIGAHNIYSLSIFSLIHFC